MPNGLSHDLAGSDPPDGPFLWLPYPLLGASFAFTVVESAGRTGGRPLVLVGALALAAAGWTGLLMRPRRPPGPHQTYYAAYLGVRLLLTAALVLLAPWFGVYAWFGYVEAIRFVTVPRVFGALFATAAITSVSYFGGLPSDAAQWAFYAGVVAAVTALVSLFAVATHRSSDRDAERERTLAALTETNLRLERALTENRALEDELLGRARETGVLDERARLAGEIHDTLAQALTGIITQLDAAGRPGPGRHDDHLDRARALAGDGLAEARRSLQALRPTALAGSRLAEALTETATRWSGTAAVDAAVDVNGNVVALDNDSEVALLRVAQEGLANVAKHAGASKVGLTLTYLDDAVLLDVRDDGVGFDLDGVGPSSDGHRLGLVTMRERLSRVGGVLAVESESGGGTALVARVPLRGDRR